MKSPQRRKVRKEKPQTDHIVILTNAANDENGISILNGLSALALRASGHPAAQGQSAYRAGMTWFFFMNCFLHPLRPCGLISSVPSASLR
jgi:hypothetical protein